MSKQLLLSRPITVDAVLEPGPTSGDGLQLVRLIRAGGELHAWSWIHVEPSNADSVLTATVHVNPFEHPLGLMSIIERIQWRPDMLITDLIPGAADGDGLAHRFRTLIQQLGHPGLQQLLQDVFVLRNMFYGYWTATISVDGQACSLAEHAIRNAELVQRSLGLSCVQRSLGVAFALLRNAGRAWPAGQWPDGHHALLLLRQIQGTTTHLAQHYPEDADVLVELLQQEYRLSLSSSAKAILEHVDYLSGTQAVDPDSNGSGVLFQSAPDNLISIEKFLRRKKTGACRW